MLRRLGIRAKVLAVLAIPIIVLLAAGAYISNTAYQQLRSTTTTTQAVEALNLYAPLSAAVNSERALSGALVPDKAAIMAARKVTDAALAAVNSATVNINVAALSDTVVKAFRKSQQEYSIDLPNSRYLVDTDARPDVIQSTYTQIITVQNDLIGQFAQTMDNRSIAVYIDAYHLVSQTTESLAQELSQGSGIIRTLASSQGAVRVFTTQTDITELYRGSLHALLDTIGNPDVTLSTADPSSSFSSERVFLTNGIALSASHVDPVAWNADIQSQLANLNSTGTRILSAARNVAESVQTQERNATIGTIGGAALAVTLSLLLALVVARSIVVPLRRLTSATADVREQLPTLVEQMAVPGQGPSLEIAQIPVTSSDEVGRLAAAFNAVNSTTLQIAQEQAALRGSIAEMFINVARRDQVLLNRQLSFIDSLERTEEDPNALANLFRLDHLATRMRRNAESLLVLAGIDTGRRVRDAMPLSDVIRTASSEIEQYDRIELELAVDPQMHGFNALGAAHLLAELFENATVFSEPETPVEVKTGVLGDHVVVQILDHGLGMSTADLVAANAKIRSTAASDSLGEQRLGLFVVGRISNRLGASVVLSKSSTGTGTVTTVSFPATLFESTEGALFGSRAMESAAQMAESDVADAPLVEAVDLAMLTDGATSLGLPRRRQRAGEDSAELSLPDLRALPQRPGRTFDESKIVLPGLAEATLAPELSGATDWSPAITASPSGGGLPSRSRATTTAWQPDDATTDTPVAPSPPETRASLFSGFRTRADLPSPAPADAPTPHGEAGSPTGFAVPGLVPDDAVAVEETTVWAPTWEEAAQPLFGGVPFIEPDVEDASEQHEHGGYTPEPTEVWSPVQAWDESVTTQPDPTVWQASEWSEPEQAQPEAPIAAPTSSYSEFSAFGGYQGRAVLADDEEPPSRYVPASRSDFAPIGFGPVLDEARAWNAGEQHAEPVNGLTETPNGHASVEPVVEHPSWDAPFAAAPQWQAPAADSVWQAPEWQAPAAEPVWQAPEWQVPAAEPVWQAPAPSVVDGESPTELFDPVEAEPAAETGSREPEPAVAPQVVTGTPTWAATPTGHPTAPAFTDLLQGGTPTDGSKGGHRRWSLFGRRKDETGAVPVAGSPEPMTAEHPFSPTYQPDAAIEQPRRSPVWGLGETAAPAATPVASAFGRPEPTVDAIGDAQEVAQPIEMTGRTWSPPSAPVPASMPEPGAPRSVASFFRPSLTPERPEAPSSWSPDWTGRSAAPGPQQPAAHPSVAPRVGALDDEVAAMLALRSDIQEQALSELSQLSAYRPSSQTNGTSSGSLTKRVPHEIPVAPAFVQAASGTPERDAEQLRSRFASYQSGTTRGRRAQAGPTITPSRIDDDPLVDSDQASTPPAPSW
jgi:anti-sigma regulatory factor (Ser/Thr protein kinase)